MNSKLTIQNKNTMGIFSKLFNNKEQIVTEPTSDVIPEVLNEDESDTESLSFMLLYKAVPKLNENSLKQRIINSFGDEVVFQMLLAKEGSLLITGTINGDKFTVAGLNFPFPQPILEKVLPICHFGEKEKKKFHKSKTHILFSIDKGNTDPHLLFNKLFQLVECLMAEDGKVIGIVNEAALTAIPLVSIQEISSERAELLTEKAIPFCTWLSITGGFVKYILDANTIWYVTKGNHQFELPELAFKGGANEGNDSLLLFHALFSYMYGYKAVLAVGHTAEIGNQQLAFTAVEEYKDLFEGTYGTLVVNKV